MNDSVELATSAFGQLMRMVLLLRETSPWVQQQTFGSLRKHTVEETFELVDAIDADRCDGVKEEIGDLFFHCVFYSVVARPHWAAHDALQSVIAKLVRRHPHVDFATMTVHKLTAQQESEAWERIKRTEKSDAPIAGRSALSGLARSTPALPRAVAMCHKLDAAGFKLVDVQQTDVAPAVQSALAALLDALRACPAAAGAAVFAITQAAAQLNVDVDSALAGVNARVERDYLRVDERANGTPLTELTRDEQLKLLLP